MKRLIAAALAVLIVCSVFMIRFPVPVSAESLYIRKIVSVVYDDSGSMKNNGSLNWAYASYAMQAFCGLLNSDDQLYITYMSEAEKNPNLDPPGIDLAASAIQSSVDSIRNHSEAGNTPYSAIDIAFNKLKSVQDPNVNTQYWLVVISDGEFQTSSGIVTESDLNEKLSSFASTVMPNHSSPQITYLAIGDNVTKPANKPANGVYVYESSGASDIVDVMSQIADKVSGRSRLNAGNIVKKGSNAIEIRSSVPLMNIAVLSQKTSAKITGASYSNGSKLNVSRAVSISYPDQWWWTTDKSLNGTAFLIDSNSANIEAGTYTIQFSGDVSLDDLVVMFEPALEMRMQILLNGKELANHQELRNASEGDKVSVSCKIYEMGTDTEVDPDLLPAGTRFEIYVSEGGKVVEQKSGKEMLLEDYTLKQVETELKSSLVIPGFNPIDYSVKFTPTAYVPKIIYSITSEYGGDVKSVKYDAIASNQDLSVVFTVYADGEALTDPAAVKALNPNITLSPQGNDGRVTYTDDGKIVFTPNVASPAPAGAESFSVEVACTLEDGTSAAKSYTVLIADYAVVPLGTDECIKKTEFFGNQVSASFYITKDGVKLDKAAVENEITVHLNQEHADLLTNVEVSPDGTITVTPYSDEEHRLTFLTWWTNWAYYFGLSGENLTVTLEHVYGTANVRIDVIGEDVKYLILNVYLPLLVELAAAIFLITYIVLVVTKPRFEKNAVLYVGNIKYDANSGNHILTNFGAELLKEYNKYGRLKPKRTADVVTVRGIDIRADRDGDIICEMGFPWYKGKVVPTEEYNLKKPKDIREYFSHPRNKRLEIKEFSMADTINGDYARGLTPANPTLGKYIVVPSKKGDVDGREVIISGKLFIYVSE